MQRQFHKTVVELLKGDITQQDTEAIVNAANERLMVGGGVDAAINRAGGPKIQEEARKIGYCPTGQAVITTGGDLKAKYVIHAVGPVYKGGGQGEARLLASCYRASLKLALERGIKSLAFPSISTGAFGYPLDEAAEIALTTVKEFVEQNEGIELVRFVLFDQRTYDAYAAALRAL